VCVTRTDDLLVVGRKGIDAELTRSYAGLTVSRLTSEADDPVVSAHPVTERDAAMAS